MMAGKRATPPHGLLAYLLILRCAGGCVHQGSISPTCLLEAFKCEDPKSVEWLMTWLPFFALLESTCIKASSKHVDEIDTWGLFYQPCIAKRKSLGSHCFAPALIILSHSVTLTKLHPILPVYTTRNYAQLLNFFL